MHVCCILQLNYYEAVSYDMDPEYTRQVHADYIVGAEEGIANIQAVTEMHSPNATQGIADLVQEDVGVPLPEFSNESAVGPLEVGLVEETSRGVGALQTDELKQFHETNNASLNGEGPGVHYFEESTVCETADEYPSNVSLGKVGEELPYMVRNVVESADIVLESARRPDSPLQENNHSVSSFTSLQDPREVIAEIPVIKPGVASQVRINDKSRMDELVLQGGDKTAAASYSQTEDNNAASATKEAPAKLHDSPETATAELLPMTVAVADFKCTIPCGLPLGKTYVDDEETAGTVAKPIGNVRVGLHPSHYADIDFSKKGTTPAPRNDLHNVAYAEIKK